MHTRTLISLLSAVLATGVGIAAASPDDPDPQAQNAAPYDPYPDMNQDTQLQPPQQQMLGVRVIEVGAELRRRMGGGADRGVLIDDVIPGTIAQRIGLRVGDLITEINGTPILTAAAVRPALARQPNGALVTVMRSGKRVQLHDITNDQAQPPQPDVQQPAQPDLQQQPAQPDTSVAPPPATTTTSSAELRRQLDEARRRIDRLERRLDMLEHMRSS